MNMTLHKNRNIYLVGTGGILLVISLVVLIVGINKYGVVNEECKKGNKAHSKSNIESDKLIAFLTKVKNEYYTNFPQYQYLDPEIKMNDIINKFHTIDTRPLAIKKRTDKSKELTQQLKDLNLQTVKLAPRERKAAAQLAHFLTSNFGHPYDENYYAGDWMLGPNYFCWQGICEIGRNLNDNFNWKNGFQPKTLKNVEKLMVILKQVKISIEQYQDNLYLGVKTGMVRSVEECNAGLNVLRNRFQNIAFQGEKGVLNETFALGLTAGKYYEKITEEIKNEFEVKYKMKISLKISEVFVEYVGAPIYTLLNYLSTNHSRHCVPSSVASGLANLPLPYIWLDQKETRIKTTGTLPTGELLNGTKSYEMILPYFTTNSEYTSEKIFQLGIKQRDILFEKAKDLAKKIKKTTNTKKAIEEFSVDLNSDAMFFNDSVIPDNESGEEGGRRCPNMNLARKNCPIRYASMQKWFKTVNEALGLIEPKISHLFYMTGEKQTTPSCPLKMKANFNPSSGSQSYLESGSMCSKPSSYLLPFFLKRPGPRYNVLSVAGHEGRPGHHTQVQGFNEHFLSTSQKKDIIDWLNSNSYYTAFTEGWALYGENPLLAQNTDLYADNYLQEYGMIKWQIWRALRLIIDTGLHSRGMTMDDALKIFKDYAWDTTDKSYKDTIRYMSGPGQATAYMIGQLAIWNMRNKTKEQLFAKNILFDEKEFHFHILSQGSSPLHYLESHISNYITCKINKTSRSDCQSILNPTTNQETITKPIGTQKRWNVIYEYHNSHLTYD